MLLSGQAMEQVKYCLSRQKKQFLSVCVFYQMYQAMPATGLGPSSMGHPGPAGLPGGPPGPGGGGGGPPLPISIPPQYSQSSYHPSYMQQVRFVSSIRSSFRYDPSHYWSAANLFTQPNATVSQKLL